MKILRLKQQRVHYQKHSRGNVLTFNSTFHYHPGTDYLNIADIQIWAMNKMYIQEQV